MYPRIPWELVAERTRGATDLADALCRCDIWLWFSKDERYWLWHFLNL